MELSFTGPVWYWRGPSPFHFVTVPEEESDVIAAAAPGLTYGWGMIPCTVSIGATTWTTSLWPKNGGYIVPLKSAVRNAEHIDVDDVVEITLRFL